MSADGSTIEVDRPLNWNYRGVGYTAPDGTLVDKYRGEVGLLTRNIVVQGDDEYSMSQQFGVQMVFSTGADVMSGSDRTSDLNIHIEN